MVPGAYGENPAADRTIAKTGRRSGRTGGRADPREQPQPGFGQHHPEKAPGDSAEQSGYGGSRADQAVDRRLPGAGHPGRARRLPQRERRAGGAAPGARGPEGKNCRVGSKRHDRPGDPGDGGRDPECGEILLYQPDFPGRQGRGGGPPRRDPHKPLVFRRERDGNPRYPRGALAQI